MLKGEKKKKKVLFNAQPRSVGNFSRAQKKGTEFVGGNVSPGTVTARGESENESQDRLVEPENSFCFHPPRLSPGFAASPC